MLRNMAKKALEPLMPLDEFKQLVAAIAQVPKETVEKAEAVRQKSPKAKLRRKSSS
jgi:hypothetical protein